jgi:hypothetical protein
VDDSVDIVDASANPTTKASVNGLDASRISRRRSIEVVAFIFRILDTVLLDV